MDGTFSVQKLRDGLGLHALDATASQDFDVTSIRDEGVVLHCILDGHADASLSGDPMNLQRRKGERVKMVLTALTEPEIFSRRSRCGDYVRKVNIILSPHWIAENGLSLPPVPSGQKRLRLEWDLDADDIQLAERLTAIAGSPDSLHRLEAEAGTLALTCRAFEHLSDLDVHGSGLRPHELRRLRRMETYIQDGQGPLPHLDDIAKEGGVSQSTMRRIFREAHGCTVLEFVRQTRLHRAKHALEFSGASISEAAQLAGYGSPENFSTAFRKYLGVTPSGLRRKIYQ